MYDYDYKEDKHLNVFQSIAIFFLVFVLTVAAAWWYFSIPVVAVSNSTGKCVEVFSDGGRFDCYNMPKKYVLEIVK